MIEQKIVSDILKRYTSLKSKRSTQEDVWDELSYFFMPEHGTDSERTDEDNRRRKSVDGTGVEACSAFTAGIYANTFTAGTELFSLDPDDETLEDVDNVKNWYAKVTDIALAKIQKSNFPQVYQEVVDYWGTFGNAITMFEYIDHELVFKNFSVMDVVPEFDSMTGELVAVFRSVKMTAKDVKAKFDSCSEEVSKKAALPDEMYSEVCVIHAVVPRDNGKKADFRKDRYVDPITSDNMEFASYWIEKDSKHLCKESGYEVFPYVAPRYKVYGDSFGRGPGHEALDDMRQLERMSYDFTFSVEMNMNPCAFTWDEEILETATIEPGRINAMTAPTSIGGTGGQPAIIWHTGGAPIQYIEPIINRYERKVKAHYHTDLFITHTNQENMTATEVAQRNEEKLTAIVPIVSRLTTEFHDPLIEGCVKLMMREGDLPELPQEMQDVKFKIQYVTRLSARMGMVKNQNLMGALQMISALAEASMAAPDLQGIIDVPKAMKEILQNANVDPDLIKSAQETKKFFQEKQAAQARQMQQQQQLEMAKATARPIDPQRKAEPGSPMDALMGGGG